MARAKMPGLVPERTVLILLLLLLSFFSGGARGEDDATCTAAGDGFEGVVAAVPTAVRVDAGWFVGLSMIWVGWVRRCCWVDAVVNNGWVGCVNPVLAIGCVGICVCICVCSCVGACTGTVATVSCPSSS